MEIKIKIFVLTFAFLIITSASTSGMLLMVGGERESRTGEEKVDEGIENADTDTDTNAKSESTPEDPASDNLNHIGKENDVDRTFSKGEGTESNPYKIENLTQLQAINDELDAHYEVQNDISAAKTNPNNVEEWVDQDYKEGDWVKYDDGGTIYTYYCHTEITDQQPPTNSDYWSEMWESSDGWNPIGDGANEFTGKLDGKGYEISKLYIARFMEPHSGLFGYVGDDGTAIDIGLIDVDVTSQTAGAIAGYNDGEIYRSYATGEVSGETVGGLVGENSGMISNTYAINEVSGEIGVGGLVGINDGKIAHSYATGEVSAIIHHDGGFVGINYDAVEHSHSNSDHNPELSLVGEDEGTITNSSMECTENMTDYESGYPNTYEEWDFETAWQSTKWNRDQKNNTGYPALRWEEVEYDLTINTEGNGTTDPHVGNHTYEKGDEITITATADDGWYLHEWTGDYPTGQSEDKQITITMDDDKELTAWFEEYATLNIDDIIGDGTVTVDGDTIETPFERNYEQGEISDLLAGSKEGWYFEDWEGIPEEHKDIALTMDKDVRITRVLFEEIGVEIEDIEVAVQPTLEYNSKQSLDLEDMEVIEYYSNGTTATVVFDDDEWLESYAADPSDGTTLDGTNHKESVTVTREDEQLTADTDPLIINHELIISIEGKGSTEPSEGEHTYEHGIEETLKATSAEHWYFDGWTGDVEDEEEQMTLIMETDKTVIAEFKENAYTLTVEIEGEGTVTDHEGFDFGGGDGGTKSYSQMTEVVLTAEPSTHYSFVKWTGDESGIENPLTVSMDADKTIMAEFREEYALTVEIEGEGAVTDHDGFDFGGGDGYGDTRNYTQMTEVVLTAKPSDHYSFVNWTGDENGTENPLTVLMDADKTIVAEFRENAYNLTVEIEGEGAVTDHEGFDFGSGGGGTRNYTQMTEVVLTAKPSDHHYFVDWTGDESGIENPLTIYMDADKTIIAEFKENTYTLTVEIEGEGAVTDHEGFYFGGTKSYTQMTEVVLTAKPSDHYSFVNWTGDVNGTENPLTVSMVADKTIVAEFKENVYTLTVEIEGEGAVTDHEGFDFGDGGVGVGTKSYTQMTEIVLTADPFEHYYFVNWTGDVNRTENPLTIYMDADKTIMPRFRENVYNLTVEIEGEGAVTDHEGFDFGGGDGGTKNYTQMAEVVLIADPSDHYSFVNWTGDVNVTAENVTITMDENKSVTVHFEIYEYRLTVDTVGEGSVYVLPDQTEYEHGIEVDLTALPDEGWRFLEWTGYYEETDDEITVIMDENKSVTAHFAEEIDDYYHLEVDVEGDGEIDIDPEQEGYEAGTEVTLTAVSADGWYFVEWIGDIFEVDEEGVVLNMTMNSDREITARFEEGEAVFEVEILEYDEEVEIRQNITGKYRVENTGAIEDTQEIVFSVRDINMTLTEVTLSLGEQKIGNFSIEAKEAIFGDGGEFRFEVITEDEMESGIIVVEGSPEPTDKGGYLSTYWWLIFVILVSTGVFIPVFLLIWRDEGKPEYEEAGQQEPGSGPDTGLEEPDPVYGSVEQISAALMDLGQTTKKRAYGYMTEERGVMMDYEEFEGELEKLIREEKVTRQPKKEGEDFYWWDGWSG